MVRLDAVDMAVQPHPPACGLGALRICRGSSDRPANRGADVQRAEHFSGEPLRRAGLRHRCAAEPWSGWSPSREKTIAMMQGQLPPQGLLMAPVKINHDNVRAFKDAESFYRWLGKHHDKET